MINLLVRKATIVLQHIVVLGASGLDEALGDRLGAKLVLSGQVAAGAWPGIWE